jgi:hypothetical protein
VDQGQLDEYAGSEPVVRIVWARPGFEDMPRLMDDEQFPWAAETLRRGQVVRFSRIDELPAVAALDRANLRRAGTRSKICLPLRVSTDGRSLENPDIGSPPTLSENVPSPIAIGRRDGCWDWRTS